MARPIIVLVALSMTACLEVSTDPHQSGGAIPLPSQLNIGPDDTQFDLDDIQAQLAGDPTSAVRPNEISDPLAPLAPEEPVAPTKPIDPSVPRFITLQQDWEAKGCSSVGQCHDQDERTIVVKMSPDAERLFLNWEQIAPPEAGGVGVAAVGSVNHFAGGNSAALWQAWQAAGYPFIE